jgi:hypothetical protein
VFTSIHCLVFKDHVALHSDIFYLIILTSFSSTGIFRQVSRLATRPLIILPPSLLLIKSDIDII